MKKIIIVNNNMKIGGVQKSLYNLLWAIADKYDVTLYLFSKTGDYLNHLPKRVQVIGCDSLFRYLGVSQGECRTNPSQYIERGILALICRLFGRKVVMRILLHSQKTLKGHFDCAISFLHNGDPHHFYGGANEFVLKKIDSERKIAFLHCDYEQCGANHKVNNSAYFKFDAIAACSDGCREAFLRVMPELRTKCVTVPNFHCYNEIKRLAAKDTVVYSTGSYHIIMVGRLAHEKGIDRAVRAVRYAQDKGISVTLHLIGSGPKEAELKNFVRDIGMEDAAIFHGKQSNPYRFMCNADLLLIASYHEAAPMVIGEACILSLPTLSVKTTSSTEMILDRGCGWVCKNDQDSLNAALVAMLRSDSNLKALKEHIKNLTFDNICTLKRFKSVIEGSHE